MEEEVADVWAEEVTEDVSDVSGAKEGGRLMKTETEAEMIRRMEEKHGAHETHDSHEAEDVKEKERKLAKRERNAARSRLAFVVLAIANQGLLWLWLEVVPTSDVIIGLLFGAYFFLFTYLNSGEENRESFKPIAPNLKVLRSMIFVSFVLSIALPVYLLCTESDPEVRKSIGRPLFWFSCERIYESLANQPNISISARISVVLTTQIYRVAVIYQWFMAAADLSVRIQLLAGANLFYWTGAVLGYGFFVVIPNYCDPDSIKRELDEL